MVMKINANTPMQFMLIGSSAEREDVFAPSQAEYGSFYEAFGECFSAWADIEGNLFSIYIFLLKSKEYDAVAASFYSTAGFKAKLDLVDAVVKNSQFISSNDLKSWLKLSEKISKKSKNRNQIAHQTIFYGRFNKNSVRKMFVAHPRTPGKGAKLYLHDLIQIRGSFIEGSKELSNFYLKLVDKK